jgi:hypothetical protein
MASGKFLALCISAMGFRILSIENGVVKTFSGYLDADTTTSCNVSATTILFTVESFFWAADMNTNPKPQMHKKKYFFMNYTNPKKSNSK